MFDRCAGKNEEIACVALTDPPLLKPDHHQCSFVVMVIDRVIDGSLHILTMTIVTIIMVKFTA